MGVTEACTSDVEVALSEACTNVLQHAPPAAQYEVRLQLTDDRCVLQVVEVQPDHASRHRRDLPADGAPASEAEHGRGLLLMRALVDRVGFRLLPGSGPVVSLENG